MNYPDVSPRFLRPEALLILLALGLATVALFPSHMRNAIDIRLHDTYYVIARSHFCLLLAIPFGLFAVIYFLTRNFRQWSFLQYFHVSSLLLPLLLMIPAFEAPEPTPYPAPNFMPLSFTFYTGGSVLVLYFLLGQVAFLVNIVAGFIRGKK